MSAASGQTLSIDWLFDELADIVNERSTQAWRVDAACLGLDVDMFFPGQGEKYEEVKAICASCPVAEPCREYALSKPCTNLLGIWAGEGKNTRRTVKERMAKERRVTVAA